jgi:hypothetical protein
VQKTACDPENFPKQLAMTSIFRQIFLHLIKVGPWPMEKIDQCNLGKAGTAILMRLSELARFSQKQANLHIFFSSTRQPQNLKTIGACKTFTWLIF